MRSAHRALPCSGLLFHPCSGLFPDVTDPLDTHLSARHIELRNLKHVA
jgi:hypothetical protein